MATRLLAARPVMTIRDGFRCVTKAIHALFRRMYVRAEHFGQFVRDTKNRLVGFRHNQERAEVFRRFRTERQGLFAVAHSMTNCNDDRRRLAESE